MGIDTTGWGVNLLAMAMKNRDGRLSFVFRGWRPALVLLILMGIILFMLWKTSTPGQGWNMLLPSWIFPPLLLLGAVAALLYIKELVFDFDLMRVVGRKGFLGFTRGFEVPFTGVEAIVVAEQGTILAHAPAENRNKPVHTGWDVRITVGPGSEEVFWRSSTEEEATRVAETLAARVGCPVKVRRNA